jgi:hypothetical protein
MVNFGAVGAIGAAAWSLLPHPCSVTAAVMSREKVASRKNPVFFFISLLSVERAPSLSWVPKSEGARLALLGLLDRLRRNPGIHLDPEQRRQIGALDDLASPLGTRAQQGPAFRGLADQLQVVDAA